MPRRPRPRRSGHESRGRTLRTSQSFRQTRSRRSPCQSAPAWTGSSPCLSPTAPILLVVFTVQQPWLPSPSSPVARSLRCTERRCVVAARALLVANFGLLWRAAIGLRQPTRHGGGCVLAHLAAGTDTAPFSCEG